jgi:lipopolysaccharide/colanic/teichoic acid biosynthesis glycosyltransferase
MKRLFEFSIALMLLLVLLPIITLFILFSSLSAGDFGVFSQVRIGLNGKAFRIYKIRTMRSSPLNLSTFTTSNDSRVTPFGAFLRRSKIDEFLQLVNILRGEMSFVGPRPDVPEMLDLLTADERRILLSVRPGVTGPASLYFWNEEKILSQQSDPIHYSKYVIYPQKVNINISYISLSPSLVDDLFIVLKTIFRVYF